MRKKLKHSYHTWLRYLLTLSMAGLTTGHNIHADSTDSEVLSLSVEELMQVEVYSVSKKAERAQDAPAAVFVITENDIRHSGATSVPELLRMVPGLQVARINNDTWAISSRGFNGRFTNKLLVLIDGRSVYTPIFSGVYWNDLDLVLEDIKQIEVIRGPGGTLWGANAVNGVINIITKNAAETKGGLLSAGGGSEEHLIGMARYGTALGENGDVRLFGKYLDRGSSTDVLREELDDKTQSGSAGARADWTFIEGDKLSLQGGFSSLGEGATYDFPILDPILVQRVTETAHVFRTHALANWSTQLAAKSELELKAFYARHDREEDFIDFSVDTYDLELQHTYSNFDRHKLVWGAGYRFISDELEGKSLVTFNPQDRNTDLANFFVQDDIVLVPELLQLVLGSKFEHNDYSGAEYQPNVRLLYTPQEEHTFWAAVSRAVRTSSRVDNDVLVTFSVRDVPPLGLAGVTLVGQSNVLSETLLAYEFGYRYTPTKELNFDLSSFYFDYNDISTAGPSEATPFGVVNGLPSLLYDFANSATAQSYGAELVINAQIQPWWRTRMWYAFMDQTTDQPNGGADILIVGDRKVAPNHQVYVGTFFDLSEGLELNGALRYVSKLGGLDSYPILNVHPYFEFDLGLDWRFSSDWELSLYGQNLLHDSHAEFPTASFPNPTGTEIERGVFGKVTVRF